MAQKTESRAAWLLFACQSSLSSGGGWSTKSGIDITEKELMPLMCEEVVGEPFTLLR